MRRFLALFVLTIFASTGIAEAKHVRSYRRSSGKWTRSYERSKANKTTKDNYGTTRKSSRRR